MVLVSLTLAAGNASSKEHYRAKASLRYTRKYSWPYGALQQVLHMGKIKNRDLKNVDQLSLGGGKAWERS